MNVLVLNSGSSSIKFQFIATDLEQIETNTDRVLAHGSVERIGTTGALIYFRTEGHLPTKSTANIPDHRSAINHVLALLVNSDPAGAGEKRQVEAVGHRIVHGGELFTKSVLITPEVVAGIEDNIELAPLHNPHNLRGYQICRELFGPELPQVAVFDTAFHQTMPPTAYLYALPYQLYKQHRIRRYGFHGLSHRFVAFYYRQIVRQERDQVNVITCHLGNGCSMAAIRAGRSIDTSMGLTPLEGLVMGTRCGDMDPAVVLHLMMQEGWQASDMDTLLNKQSGLYGVSGLTNDMRQLLAESERGNERARLAVELFCYRLKKYIGSYQAVLNGADALIFTGGIGENSATVRELACADLSNVGIELDPARNRATVGREGKVSTPASRTSVWVLPTNEELLIARDTVRTIRGIARA